MQKLALALAMASLLAASAHAADAPSTTISEAQDASAVPSARTVPQARDAQAVPAAQAVPDAAVAARTPRAASNEPLVRTFGNKTPTFVGTQAEVNQYRNELAKQQAQYNDYGGGYSYTYE